MSAHNNFYGYGYIAAHGLLILYVKEPPSFKKWVYLVWDMLINGEGYTCGHDCALQGLAILSLFSLVHSAACFLTDYMMTTVIHPYKYNVQRVFAVIPSSSSQKEIDK